MSENRKISVIVPVYNVEVYLRRCLDSLYKQTYRNLEVILIDDGSSDNSGTICEEYSRADERFLAVHQKHSGVSAARSKGLALAAGEYIGFVDSDDWIEKNMFERMLKALEENEADITVCGRWEEKGNEMIRRGWDFLEILTAEKALAALIDDEKMKGYLWDKLYCRELFSELSFPLGRTFEDTSVQDILFSRAKRIVCVPEPLYHYCKHRGSIIDDVSLKNRFYWYIAIRERHERIKNMFPSLIPESAAQCLIAAATVWSSYHAASSGERREYKMQMNEISAFSKSCPKDYFNGMELSRAIKMIVPLLSYPVWWSYALAGMIGSLYMVKNREPL